ncbi:MAG TPA: M28 family peptidase [Bacteroidales bacterium]|nr:M28 family peptidase [Bacteroidales bacterium]
MKTKNTLFWIFILVSSIHSYSQDPIWRDMAGSAFLENRSYSILQRICDEAGARMMGTVQNEKAVEILKAELENIGAPVKLEGFKAIAWFPGENSLIVKEPYEKNLKAFPATQCVAFPKIEAPLIYANYGFNEDYNGLDVNDKIVLVSGEIPTDGRKLRNMEAIEIAKNHGAKGLIIHHNAPGTMAFSTSGNYNGIPLQIPAFTTTWEEGKWLARLLEKNIPVRVEAETKSYLKEIVSNNVIVTFPGEVKDKIILGGHFDSAEKGQGAVDNGAGSAVAFEVARLINTFSPKNYLTIEIVWFNGEETGLWGSKKYLEKHRDEPIRAMINTDGMDGFPTGFNTCGFNEFRPLLEDLVERLNGFNLTDGVTETLGTNSDHVSFYLEGIPVLRVTSKKDTPVVSHYHELGDTFDKVNKKCFSEAAAVISIMIYELANNKDIKTYRRNEKEIREFCTKYDVIDILKREKEWPYQY